MAAPNKIISALHAIWWLNLAGLLLSFAASIVLVRTMPKELFRSEERRVGKECCR